MSSANMNTNNGLVLFYHHHSFYSQKVIMALNEKKIPFSTRFVDITKSEQYQPWFLKINPRGEVPVLKDGFKLIPDSIRIIDYLEDNFSNAGEERISKTLRQHAAKNPEMYDILTQKADCQEGKHKVVTEKREYAKVLEQVNVVLEKIENQLKINGEKGVNWLCCNQFTMADISLTILLDRLSRLGLEKYFWGNGKRVNIEKYYQKVQRRDSYKKAIPTVMTDVKLILKTNAQLMISLLTIMTVVAGSVFYFKRK